MMNASSKANMAGQSRVPPKKKKITRLIPAEEALAPIEECTERSEDCSVITEATDPLRSPLKNSRIGIDKLATQTIDEDEPQVKSPPLVEGVDEKEEVPKKPQNGALLAAIKEAARTGGPVVVTPETKAALSPRKVSSSAHSSSVSPSKSTPSTSNGSATKKPPVEETSSNGEGEGTSKTETISDEDEDSIQHSNSKLEATPEMLDGSKASLNASMNDMDKADESLLFNFDDDYDDDERGEEQEDTLTWRLDPSESLSDWTVMVKWKDEDKQETFHVHKNILAVGPRRCEYFVNLFRSKGRAGDSTNVTEVELGSAAANVFPNFLDFLYSMEEKLDISTESATGLRHLSQFFGVRVLHKKVMDFIQSDLTLDTVSVYYKDVCALRDEKLLTTLAKFCAKNIMKITVDFPLIKTMDPYFCANMVSCPFVNSKEKKYHASVLVAEFCLKNKERLDEKRFSLLTDEKHLPVIRHTAALTLLELEADLTAASASKVPEMSNLQRRCIKDLAHHWKELSTIEPERVAKVCRKLPSAVVTELLVKSLHNAHERPKRRNSSGGSAEWKRNGSSDSQDGEEDSSDRKKERTVKKDPKKDDTKVDAKIEKLKQEHKDELKQMKKDYEANLVRLRDLLLEKDKTISKFWHELKSYERLPNSFEGKLAQSGRQHEVTCMPELVKSDKDGYLLVSKKNGQKFPIFFYKKNDLSPSESNGSLTR